MISESLLPRSFTAHFECLICQSKVVTVRASQYLLIEINSWTKPVVEKKITTLQLILNLEFKCYFEI